MIKYSYLCYSAALTQRSALYQNPCLPPGMLTSCLILTKHARKNTTKLMVDKLEGRRHQYLKIILESPIHTRFNSYEKHDKS